MYIFHYLLGNRTALLPSPLLFAAGWVWRVSSLLIPGMRGVLSLPDAGRWKLSSSLSPADTGEVEGGGRSRVVISFSSNHLIKSPSSWVRVEAQLIPGPRWHYPCRGIKVQHLLLPYWEWKISFPLGRTEAVGVGRGGVFGWNRVSIEKKVFCCLASLLQILCLEGTGFSWSSYFLSLLKVPGWSFCGSFSGIYGTQ